MRSVYLDHTATTPLDPRVFDAMKSYFHEKYGNASSIHRFGREARAALDESREKIAGLIGAHAGEVIFVSSGTEADNFALKGIASAASAEGRNHIVTSKAEHHAVLETCEFLRKNGSDVSLVDVDENGAVNPERVERAVTARTGLISVMHANNEVGTLNKIAAISSIARSRGIAMHSDAVQSFGKVRVNVGDLGLDLMSLSAHKIYGPKGIGALYIRRGTKIDRFIHGGGQERGRRAGTENVPLAVGFARAAEIAEEEREAENRRLDILKKSFRSLLASKFASMVFNGHAVDSLPHIVNVSFDSRKLEVDGESLLFNLDLAGIAVTSGSACTSGSMEPSHVLLAMGRDEKTARASLRFSMGRSTTLEDLNYAAVTLDEIVARLGKSAQ